MNYEKMSDQEINNRVECTLDERVGLLEYDEDKDEFIGCDATGESCFSFKAKDFCNNPSDAWPIITGSKIDLRFDYDEVNHCTAFHGLLTNYHHKNPLRAAMIVYLMMKESEIKEKKTA